MAGVLAERGVLVCGGLAAGGPGDRATSGGCERVSGGRGRVRFSCAKEERVLPEFWHGRPGSSWRAGLEVLERMNLRV